MSQSLWNCSPSPLRHPDCSQLFHSFLEYYIATIILHVSKSCEESKTVSVSMSVIQELLLVDKERCMHFCAWFQQLVGATVPLGFWISRGLHVKYSFTSEGTWTCKMHICRCQSPHVIPEVPLHSMKIGLWCVFFGLENYQAYFLSSNWTQKCTSQFSVFL